MLVTKEYSLLLGQDCEDKRILPGTPFEPFEGKYIVSSYARIKDEESGDVYVIKPGDKITGVGVVEKPKPKPKARRKVKDAE